MSLRDFVTAARKHWVIVLLPVLVLGSLVGYMSMKATPQYRSSATIFVSLSSSGSATDLNQGSNYTQSQMLSYSELAGLPIVLDPVIEQLGLDVSAKQLGNRVSASAPSGTSLLTVSVTGSSPLDTTNVANAVAGELVQVIKQLAPVSDSGRGTVTATIVRGASVPLYPFSPNTRRNLMAAVFAGLLLGLVAAYLRETLDTRVRSARDVDDAVGVPVIVGAFGAQVGALRAVRARGDGRSAGRGVPQDPHEPADDRAGGCPEGLRRLVGARG